MKRLLVALSVCGAILSGVAVVPMFMDYDFVWTPRPAREAIQTYWIFRRVPPSPFWSVAAVTTNRSSVTVSNVNTLLAYEWSIAASNKLGIGVLSAIEPTPSNPLIVTDCRIEKVSVKGELPMVFQSSRDFKTWDPEIYIYGNGTARVSRVAIPGDQFRFWRAVQIGTSSSRPPLPGAAAK